MKCQKDQLEILVAVKFGLGELFVYQKQPPLGPVGRDFLVREM